MKYYKLILPIICLFFFTGCTQQYNLIITDEMIKENINVKLENTDENKSLVLQNFYPIHADINKIYQKKITEDSQFINVNLSYNYSPTDFSSANSFNECFTNKKMILNNKEYYYFELSGVTNCITNYNLDINIITENKVIFNNADKRNGNKYIWHIDPNNKNDFNLKIKIQKDSHNFSIVNYIPYIIFAFIVTIVIILVVVILKKIKRNNKV